MKKVTLISFLEELMRRYKRKPSKLAAELGTSHTTVRRWLSGIDTPNIRSCCKLAKYSGESVQKILAIVGHLSQISEESPEKWPAFREYARHKYPDELDEDIIKLVEDYIKRRKAKNHERKSE